MDHRKSVSVVSFIIALFVLTSAVSADQHLAKFFGSYVGSGKAVHTIHGDAELRAMDVTIKPYKDGGFRLDWTTVIHPADAPPEHSIQRREVTENFVPSNTITNVFISAPQGGLFSKAEIPNPLEGAPAHWATVDGDTLTVYSIAIAENGSLETQIYRRTLTKVGLDVTFLRLEDERVMLRAEGKLTRTQ